MDFLSLIDIQKKFKREKIFLQKKFLIFFWKKQNSIMEN